MCKDTFRGYPRLSQGRDRALAKADRFGCPDAREQRQGTLHELGVPLDRPIVKTAPSFCDLPGVFCNR